MLGGSKVQSPDLTEQASTNGKAASWMSPSAIWTSALSVKGSNAPDMCPTRHAQPDPSSQAT